MSKWQERQKEEIEERKQRNVSSGSSTGVRAMAEGRVVPSYKRTIASGIVGVILVLEVGVDLGNWGSLRLTEW